MIKKIVIIGPESTGKSTLCEQLAAHFKTAGVPEYAREYLLKNGTIYQYEDLYKIAEGQIMLEENIIQNSKFKTQNSKFIFIDTDLQVIKVWSEFVFNKCDNRILTQIAGRKYDLYLLCNTDVAWVKDSLREYPDLYIRKKLFHYYKETMAGQSVPWAEIKGNYNERFEMAIAAVNRLL